MARLNHKLWPELECELGATKALAFIPLIYQVAELYDTHGVPADLIRLRLQEEGFAVSEGLFTRSLKLGVRMRQGLT